MSYHFMLKIDNPVSVQNSWQKQSRFFKRRFDEHELWETWIHPNQNGTGNIHEKKKKKNLKGLFHGKIHQQQVIQLS